MQSVSRALAALAVAGLFISMTATQARANERLVDTVKKVERGELKQDPRHITELRLN